MISLHFPFCFFPCPQVGTPPIKSQFVVAVLWSKLQLPATHHWVTDPFRSLHPSCSPCSYTLLVSFLPITHSWLWRPFLSPAVPVILSLFLSPGPTSRKAGSYQKRSVKHSLPSARLWQCQQCAEQSSLQSWAQHRDALRTHRCYSLQFCFNSSYRNCRHIRKLHWHGFSLELVAVGAIGTRCCPWGAEPLLPYPISPRRALAAAELVSWQSWLLGRWSCHVSALPSGWCTRVQRGSSSRQWMGKEPTLG